MDASTRAWLERELENALGFPEVSDIAAHVTSSFASKTEVAAYLEELLGIPPSRAAAIGARLFPEPAAAPTPLVARTAEPNSRLRPAKNQRGGRSAKAPTAGGARSSLVTNCLRCGRIEHNGGRKCAFCGSALRYEALPTGASADADAGDGIPATATAGEVGEPRRDGGAPTARVWRNPELPKDAQELLERAARQLARTGRRPPRRAASGQSAAQEGVILDLAPRGRVLRDGAEYGVALA